MARQQEDRTRPRCTPKGDLGSQAIGLCWSVGDAGGGIVDPVSETQNRSDGGQIPYHQVYFGCCNRTVMTRKDIAQPKYCPFCGDAILRYNPMALPEYIVGLFQHWTHACQIVIPKKCGLCGRPSKGNWIMGYYLPCVEENRAEHADMMVERYGPR